MQPTLNEVIRQFCLKHDISLEKLAKQANMSRGSLYKLLDDSQIPSLINIVKLATTTDNHPQYLLQLKWACCQLQECGATPLRHQTHAIRSPKAQNLVNDATIFIDETIPDNSIIAAGATFTKTWTVQNVGDVAWENRFLMCMDNASEDNQLPATLRPEQPIIPIPLTMPGETVTLSVQFTAPEMPARVISYWKSVNENGELSFPDATGLYVAVRIVASSAMTHAL